MSETSEIYASEMWAETERLKRVLREVMAEFWDLSKWHNGRAPVSPGYQEACRILHPYTHGNGP